MYGSSGITVGPVKKRQRQQWAELSAGSPVINNPLYLTLDYNYIIQKPTSGNFQYSEGVFYVANQVSIEGFNRVALVHMYLNNVNFFPNNPLKQLGLSIQEIEGNELNCNFNQVGATTGNVQAKPTFLVPRNQPPDTNNEIWFTEEETNQFSVPISGLKFQKFTVKLCDESFYELNQSGQHLPTLAG